MNKFKINDRVRCYEPKPVSQTQGKLEQSEEVEKIMGTVTGIAKSGTWIEVLLDNGWVKAGHVSWFVKERRKNV